MTEAVLKPVKIPYFRKKSGKILVDFAESP